MFEPAHDDSYPSQSDFEACVAMEQCDMSPVIQWPQTVPLQDFHMQPHFGYPVSMPLPDVIDTYPAPHPQTGYPEEVQTAPPLGLELVGSEDFTAQLMQTLCKAAPPLPQQPDHLIQHAGPVISSHPVYPSQITSATGTLIDDHGRRSCVYRMCPAPRSQPLFTTEELDQWAALVRVGPQSLSGEKTLQLKQEDSTLRRSPTPTATSSRIDDVGPHGDRATSREGVANSSNAKCVQERISTPGKSPGAVEGPGKTHKTTTSRMQTKGLGRGRGGIAKKEKLPKPPPFLACFFCRGRKIACTPPAAGQADRTCNQCERRGLVCEYPLVSRRGQRPPKGLNILELGRKVRYVARRKSSVKLEDA